MSEGSSRDYRQALTDIDITKPNVARVYDYFVGGKDNFSADREFARRAMELAPKAPLSAQNNRAFLRRVVRCLVGELGITQLIDIGSGTAHGRQRQRGRAPDQPATSTSSTSTTTRSSTRTARRCSATPSTPTSSTPTSAIPATSWPIQPSRG